MIKELFTNKADAEKVGLLEQNKANKQDVDYCAKWVELLHKMVK